MKSTTEVVVELDRRGHTIVRRMRCEAPMLVRVVGESGPTLHLAMVNGAAGPLGGDHLRFRLEVGPGAMVSVCSVAASLAQPGPRGEQSELVIDLVVGEGATLDWQPLPTVSVMGSDHRVMMRLTAAKSATVAAREAVSLGRRGEESGRFALRERVTIGGVAVLDHEAEFAPGALLGPGAHGPGTSLTTEVVIAAVLPQPRVAVSDHCMHSVVHLSSNCALVTTRS